MGRSCIVQCSMLGRLTWIRADVMDWQQKRPQTSGVHSSHRIGDGGWMRWKRSMRRGQTIINTSSHHRIVGEKESFCVRTALMQRKRLSQLIRHFLLLCRHYCVAAALGSTQQLA